MGGESNLRLKLQDIDSCNTSIALSMVTRKRSARAARHLRVQVRARGTAQPFWGRHQFYSVLDDSVDPKLIFFGLIDVVLM